MPKSQKNNHHDNSPKKKKLRNLVLWSVCDNIHDAVTENNGRKPYGLVQGIDNFQIAEIFFDLRK